MPPLHQPLLEQRIGVRQEQLLVKLEHYEPPHSRSNLSQTPLGRSSHLPVQRNTPFCRLAAGEGRGARAYPSLQAIGMV